MAKQAQQQNKKKLKISTVLIFLFCCIVAFTMLVPFVWMVSASFKLNSEIFSYPFPSFSVIFPSEQTFSHSPQEMQASVA